MPTMPKRSNELQRPRERKGVRDPITYGQLRPVDHSHFLPDEEWHPTARMLWDSAFTSGQSDYYQDSDLAVLFHICEELSEYKNSTRRSAQLLGEISKLMGGLMFTEGDRRQVRLELQAPKDEEKGLEELAHDAYADFFQAGTKVPDEAPAKGRSA